MLKKCKKIIVSALAVVALVTVVGVPVAEANTVWTSSTLASWKNTGQTPRAQSAISTNSGQVRTRASLNNSVFTVWTTAASSGTSAVVVSTRNSATFRGEFQRRANSTSSWSNLTTHVHIW